MFPPQIPAPSAQEDLLNEGEEDEMWEREGERKEDRKRERQRNEKRQRKVWYYCELN